MNTTLLAIKTDPSPMARNDEHHLILTSDPSITAFPQISSSPINLTEAGSNAAQNAEVLVAVDSETQSWINKRWRPMLGWVYIITCVVDFIIFPILWSLLQAVSKGQVTSQWQPLTLMGAGLYHVAMGACIGITSYGRTKEKMAEKA